MLPIAASAPASASPRLTPPIPSTASIRPPFGNQDYYIEANGSYVPLGTTALSVQMTLQNNGDTDVASTVTMRGPAEYWDNLAVQIASSDPSGDAGSSLTPQFVLRDLLYARGRLGQYRRLRRI